MRCHPSPLVTASLLAVLVASGCSEAPDDASIASVGAGGGGGATSGVTVTGGTTTATTAGSGGSTSSSGGGGGALGPAPRDDASVYFYGHSLVDFSAPDSQVGTAMCSTASSDGVGCCADGQWPGGLAPSAFAFYGYPPEPGQSHQPSCWQGWNGSFASAGIDTLVITEANFIQYEGPGASVAAGADLIETVRGADPTLPVYLYEHWPELEGAITFDSWKNGDYQAFHDWFAALQDGLNAEVAGPPVRLVPVGRLFARTLTQVEGLDALAMSDLFVDTAPHGTATSYAISGLVHYMAIYQRRPEGPAPGSVHALVAQHWGKMVDFMWEELAEVRDGSGASRVW